MRFRTRVRFPAPPLISFTFSSAMGSLGPFAEEGVAKGSGRPARAKPRTSCLVFVGPAELRANKFVVLIEINGLYSEDIVRRIYVEHGNRREASRAVALSCSCPRSSAWPASDHRAATGYPIGD
jgi:hypothetical protein